MFRVMMSLRERFYFHYRFILRSHPKGVAIVHRNITDYWHLAKYFCIICSTSSAGVI